LLTSELIRVRRKGAAITPQYVRGPAAERLSAVAAAYVDILSAHVGRSRDEIDAALSAVPVPARDRVAALGLRKVLEDGCEFEVREGVDAEAIRREVFLAAAAAHRDLDVRARFDRDAVLAESAARLGTSPAALEEGLYADLRGAELLRSLAAPSPEILLDRYNLSLAQSILLRAARVQVRVEGESPARYRRIFRAARFHGLIHVVRGDPASGYTIALDGPFSLFDQVQKYGLRLAMFLPAVLPCAQFRVRAEVLWGRERQAASFEIGPEDKLVFHGRELPDTTPELTAFCDGFRRLSSVWSVAQSERIFALLGEEVCVPDLVFENRDTGEEVYLEAFGFWSRAAVWRRIEQIRRGLPARLILAVGRQLRVSQEVLGEEDAGEIYVYRATMSPRAVLERLERRG
jgi:predicted nuclease of restriction endonuclease-like RecB superfamily